MTGLLSGAMREAKMLNCQIVPGGAIEDAGAELDGAAAVFVDWDDMTETGPRLISNIRKANGNMPILLFACKANMNTTFSGMKAGASAVVSKPIVPDELKNLLLSQLRKSQTGNRPTVNVEFINPFVDATFNVFRTMAGMEVERKKLFLKDDHKMFGDLSGVMGLSGAASGTVVVSMPERLACILVGNLLGEPPAEALTSDTCDGVGELVNMIAGQAKAALTKTKYNFSISLPSVVSGTDHEISHKKGTPNIVVKFAAGEHDFHLQVCLAPSEE